MAEEDTAPDEGTEPKKKKSLPPFVLPLVLALVGIAGGGIVGAKVVGPRLTKGFSDGHTAAADSLAHASKKGGTDEEAAADGEHDAAKGGGDHGEGGAPPLYTISDLVLNPAGSGGTRFLMLSVAFDMKDSAAVEVLKQRDAEIKDAVLALVGGKTVDQLAEVSAREPLKIEIRDLVGRITKKPKAITRVSFPQFVIQ